MKASEVTMLQIYAARTRLRREVDEAMQRFTQATKLPLELTATADPETPVTKMDLAIWVPDKEE